MRIITGSARGCKLQTLPGENTRPTPERVKEAVFSMLQFELEGKRVLELFGGSGQLSLEALSRGAESAMIADSSREACEIIKENAKKTKLYEKCRVICTDYASAIRALSGREKFDLVLLDPPYASDYLADCLDKLVKADILEDGAKIVCESEADKIPHHDLLREIKQTGYGRVRITVLQNGGDE